MKKAVLKSISPDKPDDFNLMTRAQADEIDNKIKSAPKSKKKDINQPNLPVVSPEQFAPILDWIKNSPPERKWILDDMIPSSKVGVLSAAGGVGKSNLSNLIAFSITTGRTIGPFKPPKARRVFILNVEDEAEDMWRRFHFLAKLYDVSSKDKKLIQKNLFIYPGVGKIGPLMEFEGNNPKPTVYADWLKKSIIASKPDLVILDTKSRLYGLSENDNDHNTRWLQLLEQITTLTKCSFLIVHHVAKSRDELSASAGRGGSSLIDNSRFVISAASLNEQDAKDFELDTPENYFKLRLEKSSYAPKTPIYYFERLNEGIPKCVELKAERLERIAELMVKFLADQDKKFTRREIIRGAKKELKPLKEKLKDYKAVKNINEVLDFALKTGSLKEVDSKREGGGRTRVELEAVCY